MARIRKSRIRSQRRPPRRSKRTQRRPPRRSKRTQRRPPRRSKSTQRRPPRRTPRRSKRISRRTKSISSSSSSSPIIKKAKSNQIKKQIDNNFVSPLITFLKKPKVESTSYEGSILNQICEIIYFIKTYKPCYLIGSLMVTGGFETDDLALSWDENTKTLYPPMGLEEGIKKCKLSNKRFSILGIIIKTKQGFHANFLLYDKNVNEIERFEPHGKGELTGKEINQAFKNLFAKFGIKYISQIDFCPVLGPQFFDEVYGKKLKTDPGGFCQAWSTYWISLRLANPDISREILMDKLMKSIKLGDFKNFIRNFSFYILQERDEILKDFKLKFGYSWPEKPNSRQITDLETMLGDAIIESHRKN